MSLITRSGPRAALASRITFSRSWPSRFTAAILKFVSPRSTPMEKSGIEEFLLEGEKVGVARALAANGIFLAFRTVLVAASTDHDSFDRRFENQAGFAFPPIDAMLKLKKSFFAFRVDVIRNRGPAQFDCFGQNFAH